jgi:CheY-like chemotaxis protein
MPKILLVEDNEMNRDMLARRLKRRGYDVIIAIDGEQAVTKAKTSEPDLILLDINLPIIDGYEVARQVRSAPESRFIPILGLSSHAMAGDREKAIEAGCNDYDTKPVEMQRLIEKIQRLLKSKKVR